VIFSYCGILVFTPLSVVDGSQSFGGIYCLCLQDLIVLGEKPIGLYRYVARNVVTQTHGRAVEGGGGLNPDRAPYPDSLPWVRVCTFYSSCLYIPTDPSSFALQSRRKRRNVTSKHRYPPIRLHGVRTQKTTILSLNLI
jgi:hypothetical protein